MEIRKPLVNREDLQEGRQQGLGFSIFKKFPRYYLPLIDFTACKDFLNEVSFGEKYKRSSEKFGFKHDYINYFEHSDLMYLAIKPVHKKNGNEYPAYGMLYETMLTNYKKVLNVLNFFDRKLGVRKTTAKLEEYDGETIIIFKCDKFWLEETVRLSLFTLLIRYYINYNKRVGKDLLNHSPFIDEDEYLINGKQISKLLNNLEKLKEVDIPQDTSATKVHNNGIMNFINTKI